jgi:membrane protein DedA with SNARE-associated domain
MDLIGASGLDGLLKGLAANPGIALAAIFAIMVLEGLIVTTFIFSGSLTLLAAGALVQAGALSFPAAFATIVAGFWLGDWLNYRLGHRGEAWFRSLGVVRRREATVARAEALLLRWGWAAVFISRFMGPARPFVTFLAGVFGVRPLAFHLATLACTAVLTAGLLHAGMTGMQLVRTLR